MIWKKAENSIRFDNQALSDAVQKINNQDVVRELWFFQIINSILLFEPEVEVKLGQIFNIVSLLQTWIYYFFK